MSDRYDPDRAPSPWDEDGGYQPRPRRPSSSSRGGGGPRSGGRPPSGQPQPPYGWDDPSAPGYGMPAQPSHPRSGYPPSGYPQSGNPPQPYPPYGQPDGYGGYGEYGPPQRPRTPSRNLGRQPGSGQYGPDQYGPGQPYGNDDPYAGGGQAGRMGPRTGYGQQGGMSGMLPPGDYRDAPTTGWGDEWSQPTSGRPPESYFPVLPDPQSRALGRYGTGYQDNSVGTLARREPGRKRRSLKWLWITLAVVVVLLGAGGAAAVWAIGQFAAPGVAAGQFCANLSQQNYDTAYAQLSASMRTSLTQPQFHSDAADLDTAEGKVVSCRASGSASYSLGSTTAKVGLVVTRAKQGELTGDVHLKQEGGAWKVDAIDTALLGVNLGAVQAIQAYCAALQGQKYDEAYALLDSAQQSAQKVDAFTSDAKLHDQIDGTVSACTLDAVASGNTDTKAAITVAITRAKLGAKTGKLELSGSGSQWKLTSIDQAVQGTDLRPLAAGQSFCSLLSRAKYDTAYDGTSSGFKQATTKAEFIALFNISGVKWSCGSVNLSTYKVVDNTAGYVVPLIAKDAASGTTLLNENRGLLFVFEASAWKLQYFGDPAQVGG